MNRLSVVIATLIFAFGCGKDINNKEAVKKGVEEYLASRQSQTGLTMNAMEVSVTSVDFQKDEARAVVAFKVKGDTSGGGGMAMNYVLERKGAKWVVKGRQENGLNPHGGGAMPPGGAMPGGAMPTEGALPPNHPPVEGAKPETGK